MKIYKCEKCGRHFGKKHTLTVHMNRKIPCDAKPITTGNIIQKLEKDVANTKKEVDEIKIKVEETIEKTDKLENKLKNIEVVEVEEVVKVEEAEKINEVEIKKTKIKQVFESMEQTLYLDGIVGEKARDDIISLFILRLLEDKFKNNEIDIMDIEKHHYNERLINKENIQYCLMSKLAEEKSYENIFTNFKRMWEYVLSKHNLTKHIYRINSFINITNQTTLSNLIKDLSKVSFENNNDTLSDIYQHFILKQFKGEKGSKLGQHFTPLKIKKFIVNDLSNTFNINPKIIDPFGGTSGFLLESYEYMKQFNIDPNNYLFSKEIDADVQRYAIANILIRTGKICEGLIHEDAFKETNNKYTHIITNPPFGGSFKKDQLDSSWFADIKTNNRNLLTLQLLMKLLDNNGYCSMIWPYGGEISGTKKAELAVRTKLIDEFKLEKVIILPKGIFEYTNIATVILKFTTGKTEAVTFCKFDGSIETIEFIKTYEEIKNKKYSLRFEDYIEREQMNIKNNFEMKKLGEICDIQQGYALSKKDMMTGIIKVMGGGKCIGYHNKHNHERNEIVIPRVGNITINYMDDIYYLTDNGLSIKEKENNINIKFLYYLLKFYIDKIDELYVGVAQKVISVKNISNLEIPVPSIEDQEKIIKIMEGFEEDKKNFQNAVDSIKKQIDYLSKKEFNFDGKVEIKKLGEICEFQNGKNITKDKLIEGPYPVIGGGVKPMGFHNKYNVDELTTIISKDGANAGIISRYNIKVFVANHGIFIKNYKNINKEYVYYFMKNNLQDEIFKLQTGAAQPGVNSKDIANLEIPVPSIEDQEKIVKIFDKKYLIIEELETSIIDSDKLSKEIFNLFIN